jgi:hypothetical protein
MGVLIDDYLITMKFEDHQVVVAQNSYNLKFMMHILHTSYNLQEMELQVNFNKTRYLVQVYTNKTPVMPFIPTKSVACMSTSWLLGNVYMTKPCKGEKQDPDTLKFGLVGYGRQS